MSGAKTSVLSLLSDRRFAAGILALSVLVFTPIGARLSLGRAVDRTEEQFFTGVDGRGAIADFLDDVENAATGLLSVASGYEAAEEEAGALRVDRTFLNDAMEGEDISEYFSANELVTASFNALRDTLRSLPLSEQDAEDLRYYSDLFDNAQGAILHAGYNEAAEAFIEDTYDRFPAKLLASLLGVEPPEKFQ